MKYGGESSKVDFKYILFVQQLVATSHEKERLTSKTE